MLGDELNNVGREIDELEQERGRNEQVRANANRYRSEWPPEDAAARVGYSVLEAMWAAHTARSLSPRTRTLRGGTPTALVSPE